MRWYLVHTKPRQETCALENLRRKGYQCYLPTLPSEKLRQNVVGMIDGPLFPHYCLFAWAREIRLQAGHPSVRPKVSAGW